MRVMFKVSLKSAKILLSNLKKSNSAGERYYSKVVNLASVFPLFQKAQFYGDIPTQNVPLEDFQRTHSGGPFIVINEDEKSGGVNPHIRGHCSGVYLEKEIKEALLDFFSFNRGYCREFIPLDNFDCKGNDLWIVPNTSDLEDSIYNENNAKINYSTIWGWPRMQVLGGKNPKDAIQAYIFAQRSKNEMPICEIGFGGHEINQGYEWNRGNPIIVPQEKNVPLALESSLYENYRDARIKLENKK